MQELSIGTAKPIKTLKERLDYEFKFLQEEGIDISVRQINRGNITFLGCDLINGNQQRFAPEDASTIMRHFVANALSDVIINEWENSLVKKIIKNCYSYFGKEEQANIHAHVLKFLNGQAGNEKDLFHRLNRKSQILAKLVDYLDRSDELVLEGFVTFRLKEYMEELEDAVETAVDDYLLEREYKEFIKLLRYFVEAQEPKLDRVNVIVQPTGTFKLTDSKNVPIETDLSREFIADMIDGEVEYEDILISSLITMAPRQVVIHQRENEGQSTSVETLKMVFGDRVTFCDGCSLCEPLNKH